MYCVGRRNPRFLEDFQDGDMGYSPRSSSGEDQRHGRLSGGKQCGGQQHDA